MMPLFTKKPWFITLMWVFVAAVFVSALNVLAYFYWLGPPSGHSLFILSNLKVNGPTELCPGETLDFQFDVKVLSVGTYNLWASTWKVDPPPSTIIFSETEPFVIGSKREFPIVRSWRVPVLYEDKADNMMKPLSPGAYTRDISVTAEGKDTENDPLIINYDIRNDCERLDGTKSNLNRFSLSHRSNRIYKSTDYLNADNEVVFLDR